MVSQLHAYVDAWRRHDVPGVLSTLTDDRVVIESFSCTWQGKATTFDGANIARLSENKIAYLREYATHGAALRLDW